MGLKKIPNISHIPRNFDELSNILLFLEIDREVDDLCDFIKISVLQKNNLSFLENKRKDSTERKWINHLIKINLVEKSEIKGKVTLTKVSRDFINKKIDLRELVLEATNSNPDFASVLNDLIDLSYFVTEFETISELYSKLQEEFGYIDRPVSAVRNLTGMINFLTIGKIVLKKKSLLLNDRIFFQNKDYDQYKNLVYGFILQNSKYASYASIQELMKFMIRSLPEWNKNRIELFLKRILRSEKSISFQEASSNKETGVIFKKKNILFIRIKENDQIR